MLVVDRRDDEGAYDPGANRAAVQAELEKQGFHLHGTLESNAIPAQVEVEIPPTSASASAPQTEEARASDIPQWGNVDTTKSKQTPGIPVLVSTPGPEVLLKLMTERVWGVRVP